MKTSVLKISTLAMQLLQEHPNIQVHSIYKNTINLSLGGRLISLQSTNSLLSPVGIILSDSLTTFASSFPKPEESVCFDGDVLQFKRSPLCIFMHESELICSQFQSNPVCLPALHQRVQTVLHSAPPSGFQSSDVLTAASTSFIENARKSLLQNNVTQAVFHLQKLMGLGIGLTPSGDDFLCGMMFALLLRGESVKPLFHSLGTAIQSNLWRTNEISANFLYFATQQHFHEALLNLCTVPDVNFIQNQFLSIGHTSGLDTLTGLCFGLDFPTFA